MKQHSRSVPFVYGAIAGILLIIIAAMAFVFVPASPPQIAEFAPQAVEQIEDSPKQQSSQFGSGAGGVCAKGQLCEGPDTVGISPPRRVIEKARVRRCIGDPPRQTEDPQSPPCVNYFEGNNGGATGKGVTRDEIRVAIMPLNGSGGRFSRAPNAQLEMLVAHFNRRYEFYGRVIRTVYLDPKGDETNPAVQRAMAQRAAEELDAFAVVGTSYPSTDHRVFYAELARRGVIGIAPDPDYMTQSDLAAGRPFLWTYGATLDQLLRNDAEWMCKSLADRPARWAGAQLSASRRSFGILRTVPPAGAQDVSLITSGLARCDSPAKVVDAPAAGPGITTNDYRLPVAQLQSDGVTSIFCVCGGEDFYYATAAAQDNRYEPEWVLSGQLNSSSGNAGHIAQLPRTFGMAGINKMIRDEDQPWYHAIQEIDSQTTPFTPQNDGDRESLAMIYHTLLVAASGVQWAGPSLTTANFEKGLLGLRFANPGSGQPPYWQASVGFGPDDRSMMDDYALVYWDVAANTTVVPPGPGKCFVGSGLRWSLGSWPHGEPAFFDKTKDCS